MLPPKIDKQYCYRYPHPALTVDCVIFGFDGESLKVLLIERGLEPYKGMWALPGGFMRIDETVDDAAMRELREETGLDNIYLEQFKVYSAVNRDPRERVVTVAYLAIVRPSDFMLIAGDDAANAMWFDSRLLPPMAFDHTNIIRDARRRLAELIKNRPVAFNMLDEIFTLGQLQRLYELINETAYDRRNFQRKALQSGIITEIDDKNVQSSGASSKPVTTPPSEARGRPSRNFFKLVTKFGKGDKQQDDNESSTKHLFDFD